MAKSGKSGKKMAKGFGFYLLMLILLIVVAFFIIVGIMMFAPKTVILGYQYFYIGDSKTLTTTTDKSATSLDFSTTTKIVVNAHNSRVSVVMDPKIEKAQVVIVAKANGFSSASDNVELSYSVVYEDSVLKINVTEPEGFLLFSNDLQVIIKSPVSSEYKFENTAFDIKTTSGSVTIGNAKGSDSKSLVDIDDLSIKTGSGSVELNDGLDLTIKNLAISTGSGSINFNYKPLEKDDMKTLEIANETVLATSSGAIDLKKVVLKMGENADKTLTLKLGNGSANITSLRGSINLIASSASLKVGEMYGDLTANETSDTINASQIYAEKVHGSVSLPCLKASNVTLVYVSEQINIETTSGNVTIGKGNLGITLPTTYIKTTSGTINAIVGYQATTQTSNHYFVTDSGNINLVYNSSIITKHHIVSNTGNVSVKVGSDYTFKLYLRNAKKELYEKMNDKLSLTFMPNITFENGIAVNGYKGDSKVIDIATDGHISVGLI